MKTRPESRRSFLKDRVTLLTIALSVVIGVLVYVCHLVIISGSSMEPTLQEYDFVVVNTYIPYLLFQSPQRGDIVKVCIPEPFKVLGISLTRCRYLAKRIVGLPGEEIIVRYDGAVYVNNQLLEEPYIRFGIGEYGQVAFRCGPDEYVVLGDNRGPSLDSRKFGPISKKQILGKFIMMYRHSDGSLRSPYQKTSRDFRTPGNTRRFFVKGLAPALAGLPNLNPVVSSRARDGSGLLCLSLFDGHRFCEVSWLIHTPKFAFQISVGQARLNDKVGQVSFDYSTVTDLAKLRGLSTSLLVSTPK